LRDGYPNTQEELIVERHAFMEEEERHRRMIRNLEIKVRREAAKKVAQRVAKEKARKRALRLFVPH